MEEEKASEEHGIQEFVFPELKPKEKKPKVSAVLDSQVSAEQTAQETSGSSTEQINVPKTQFVPEPVQPPVPVAPMVQTVPEENLKQQVNEREIVREVIRQEVSFHRLASGIPGFDEISEGGIPVDSVVLVKGASGSGKTTFGFNFLIEGIMRGENGCFISLRNSRREIGEAMKPFNWGLEGFVRDGNLLIERIEVSDMDSFLKRIAESVSSINAKRLVVDSFSLISLNLQGVGRVRKAAFEFERFVKKLGCTSLVLLDSNNALQGLTEMIESGSDGVVELVFDKREGLLKRGISIKKMRATNHSLATHGFAVEKGKGAVVFSEERLS